MKRIKIEGMSCSHCEKSVNDELLSLGGKNIKIDLKEGIVLVDINVNNEEIISSIEDLGYTILSIEDM